MGESVKKGWQGPNICVMCKAEEETIDQLFPICPFSICIWERVMYTLSLQAAHLPHSMDLLRTSRRYEVIYKQDRVL